ncbi:hypothetical protein V8F20_005544 [Naviculisporaceae sp. PSN 640]
MFVCASRLVGVEDMCHVGLTMPSVSCRDGILPSWHLKLFSCTQCIDAAQSQATFRCYGTLPVVVTLHITYTYLVSDNGVLLLMYTVYLLGCLLLCSILPSFCYQLQ